MHKKKMMLLILLLSLLVLSQAAWASTIQGTIYDFSLEKVPNARVSITTEPKQQLIAENASYRFDVPAGRYTLLAQQLERGKIIAQAEENITIPAQGTFRLDLILFPSFAEEEELMQTTIPVEEIVEKGGLPITYYVIGGFLLTLFIFLGVLFVKIKKMSHVIKQKTKIGKMEETEATKIEKGEKETTQILPKDLQEMVNFIKAQDSRTTQKDIRKQFPLSEAKISLMIADLEQRGIVQKIKKGRGNIVILKEK